MIEEQTHSNQLPLFAGYPSYSWKIILGSDKRRPENLKKLILSRKIKIEWSKQNQLLAVKDPNFADAFLLAITILKFKNAAFESKSSPEGWILGS